ncbi:MAG: carboxypeptidase regulatory-like domain-containing protein [Candidatus Sulfotelmatobacter sp.]
MHQRLVILSEAFFAERGTYGSHGAAFVACPEQAKRAEGCSLRRNKREATFLIAFALTVLLFTSFASAQTLTGTVKNSTTGKPAAGDDVVLLKLAQGMEEAGRTKTDAQGHFTFKLDDTQSPHLVRVIHQEVTYHRMAPPGTTSVELEVYDVGKKIDGISVVADVMRVQAEQGQLEVMRAFAVQNTSKPPRTQMNEHNLEFYVPAGAKVIDGSAMTAGGQPITSAPVPEGEKNRYAFIFPLRPGITTFQVAYQLPYSGSANLDPKSIYPLEHFVAILPKSMQFNSNTGAGFSPMDDPNQPDSIVQVASNTKLGQNLAFKVSGEGVLETRQEGNSSQGSEVSPPEGGQAKARPGGGLGPPIDAPDPLQKYRWQILAGIAAALIIGGVYVAVRQQSAARTLARQTPASSLSGSMQDDDYAPAETHARPVARPTSMLLEGLKEELFQLEVERRQGQISQAEYEKAKSALDQTLERALKREAQKA